MLPTGSFFDWLTAFSLFVVLAAALEVCFSLGQRARRRRTEHPDQLATIQAATLGLLALLLGFSFARAAGRFSDRTQLIVHEANAIGTAWLRCDMLPGDVRVELRGLFKDYIEQRIAFDDAANAEASKSAIAASEDLQARLWERVAAAGRPSPSVAAVLWPPFNELIDVHALRVAAANRHLPGMLLLLLLACSLVSVAAVGYGCGVAGKRNVVLTTALTFLISGALWAIIDMDHPRKGLIRAGQQPMLDLRANCDR
jgi:hypothetical protein